MTNIGVIRAALRSHSGIRSLKRIAATNPLPAMNASLTRREFLRVSTVAAAGAALAPATGRGASADGSGFSFVLLGDLHYDKLDHHDFAWLDKTHPNDLSQIKNYSR